MDRVTECQWDRALSVRWNEHLHFYGMIFGNGIFDTLERTFAVYLERVTE